MLIVYMIHMIHMAQWPCICTVWHPRYNVGRPLCCSGARGGERKQKRETWNPRSRPPNWDYLETFLFWSLRAPVDSLVRLPTISYRNPVRCFSPDSGHFTPLKKMGGVLLPASPVSPRAPVRCHSWRRVPSWVSDSQSMLHSPLQ